MQIGYGLPHEFALEKCGDFICNLYCCRDSIIWRAGMAPLTETVTSQDPLSDDEVVARVLAGETSMFEVITRRYNQRLYRVARAILRNDSEAEDVNAGCVRACVRASGPVCWEGKVLHLADPDRSA